MSNNYGYYLGGENNAGDYIGVVDGKEIAFPSREEYLEYLDEIRKEKEQEEKYEVRSDILELANNMRLQSSL